jgi:DNA replication factor GINS
LKSDYEREYAIDPFSTKTKLASKALTEFTDLVEMTFDARMKKISAMALRAAEGNKVDTSKLTREEKEIFDRIHDLMKDSHGNLIEGKAIRLVDAETTPVTAKTSATTEEVKKEVLVAPSIKPEIAQPLPVVATVAPIEQPKSQNVAVKTPTSVQKAPDVPPAVVRSTPQPAPSAEKAAVPTSVLLRILEDIPPFAASDRNYNLKKEDVVSLPPAIAKTLIARKKAVGVQHSDFKF